MFYTDHVFEKLVAEDITLSPICSFLRNFVWCHIQEILCEDTRYEYNAQCLYCT